LYAQFRPQIPDGVKGWGAKGSFDLDKVKALIRARRAAELTEAGATL